MGMVFNSNRFASTLRTKDGSDSVQIPGKSTITVDDKYHEEGCDIPAGVMLVGVVVDESASVSEPGAEQPVVTLTELAPAPKTVDPPKDQKKEPPTPKPKSDGAQ